MKPKMSFFNWLHEFGTCQLAHINRRVSTNACLLIAPLSCLRETLLTMFPMQQEIIAIGCELGELGITSVKLAPLCSLRNTDFLVMRGLWKPTRKYARSSVLRIYYIHLDILHPRSIQSIGGQCFAFNPAKSEFMQREWRISSKQRHGLLEI